MSDDSATTEDPQPTPLRKAIWAILGALAVVIIMLRLVTGGARSFAPLPVLAEIPHFELIDQRAEPFGTAQLEGRPWVASFIYSTCPGPCPMVVQRLGALKRRVSDDPRLTIVSITVDPEGDTPAVLEAYGKTHAINPDRWKLLTGEYETVLDVARKTFMLAVVKNEGLSPEQLAEQGAVTHSTKLVLVDRKLKIRGYYDSNDADEMRQLADHALRLLESPA